MALYPSLSECIKEVEKCNWYWGAISYGDCKRLLLDEPIGTFLVRDSKSSDCIFTIVYKSEDGIKHSRVPRFQGKFCLGGPNSLIQEVSFVDFINKLIDCSRDPQRGILTRPEMDLPAQDVLLKEPLSRYRRVPSLMYFCRLVIREFWKESNELPLPTFMKEYITDKKYYLVHYPRWEQKNQNQ